MKRLLFIFSLILFFFSKNVFGQYTLSPSSGVSVCPSSNNTCATPNYLGLTVKMTLTFSGNTGTFTISKCDNTNFSLAGTFYLKEVNPCGSILTQTSVSSGTSSKSLTFSLLNSGNVRTYYGVYIPTSTPNSKYYTGPITVTPQPNLTIGSNISFGTTTLYSGVNYTGTFSVSNTGSATWSGSMYVVFGHGGSLNATGPSTINAGSTQNFTVSYTPNTSVSGSSASASYQTSGQGSGITVPGQSPPSLNIIGNLAISGNAASPSSGIQNNTNFSFSATTSNVAPSPTATVDIEFQSPDGVYNTTTNISRSGNNYSHTQSLQQVGTYRYRFIAYQGIRPNAASGWQNITVSAPTCTVTYPNPANVTISSVNATGFRGTWPAVSGATEYQVNYAKKGDAYPAANPANTTTNLYFNFAGLVPSTQYKFQIRAKCSNGVWSSTWSQTLAEPFTAGPIELNPLPSLMTWHCSKDITWGSYPGTGNVTIELWKKLGTNSYSFTAELATNIANNGSFSWIVGKQTSNATDITNFDVNATYQIKIYPHGSQGQGTPSSDFIIDKPVITTINSPTATNYFKGSNMSIVWQTTSNLCGPVTIEYTNASNVRVDDIVIDTPNDGTHTWAIPPTLADGQYKIKIYMGVSGGSSPVVQYSSIFNVVSQSVTVSSPAASSTYQAGTSLPITYIFSGYTGNVSIEITAGTNGTVGILPAIADGEPNIGSKSWTIPTTFSPGQYRIKVYNTGSGSIVNYSGVFTITGNSACPTANCLTSGITETNFPNTGQDGFCAAQYLCSKGIIQPQQNIVGYTPIDQINRIDLAKTILYALLDDGNAATYHANPATISFGNLATYFTPFEDLNYSNNATDYDRPAKVLSYLYYSNDLNGRTPFKRTREKFYPYAKITKMDFLQVLLEAWNVTIGVTSAVPYQDDFSQVPAETMDYIKRAYALGIITYNATTNPLFRPYDNIKREEVFLILARLRQLSTQPKPTQAQVTNAANYIFERNITTNNVSIMRSMGEGNFAYSEGGFSIPDIGLPLSFGFSYNSFLTHLPDIYRSIEPLGNGWTHNLNSYIISTNASITDGNVTIGKPLLLLANGDGTWHTFDNSNPSNPIKNSIDNFNSITKISATAYELKRPDLVVFRYEQRGSEAGIFRLVSIKDRHTNTISLVYKAGASVPFSGYNQVLDYVQAQSGRRAVFTYNTKNQITEITFPGKVSNTRKLKFEYYAGWDGSSNYLRKYYTPRFYGTTKGTTYTYGSGLQKNLLVSVINPKGNEIKTEFNAENKTTKIQEVNGAAVASTTTIEPTGSNPLCAKCAKITGSDGIAVNQKIDLNGTIFEHTSPTVNLVRPENENNPSNPSFFEVNGKRTKYEYNGVGNVLRVDYLKADKVTTHSFELFGYDPTYNNLTSHQDANGIITTLVYSADGKTLNQVQQPYATGQNLNQSFTYYANGLLHETISHENIKTEFFYDAYGNNNRILFPSLTLNSYATFDYAGRTETMTDAKGKVTIMVYDDNNNLKQTTAPSPLSYITQYDYDDNDNLWTITNAKGKVTTIGRDNYDRIETISFETMLQKYYYRSDGKIDKYEKTGFSTMPNSYYQYTYDTEGRLKANRYLTNTTFDATTKNLTAIQGGNTNMSLTNFTYDDLNRPTGYTDQANTAIGYAYDNNSNVIRIDYPNSYKVHYTYDQANRLKTVKWNTTTVANYVYVGSRLDYVEYGNGVRTKYNYDLSGRLEGVTTKTNNGTGSTIAAYTYTFDNVGNHLSENNTEPYAAPTTPPASSTAYTYNTKNQILTAGNISFTHDGNGNIITKGGLTYTYDLEDNLVSIAGNGLSITFEYDALGNRRVANRNGTNVRYVLDMLGMADVLAEMSSATTAQNYYIHGLGLIARVKGDGTTIAYYHGDFRGSVVAMTNASQAITHKYQYDEFGNLLNSQEADANPYRYVGLYGVMYETPDLAYMRARYYDPTIGRFNGADPIWSTNLYPYANNNGVMNVDASGNIPVLIPIAVGAYALIVYGNSLLNVITSLVLQTQSMYYSIDHEISGDLNSLNMARSTFKLSDQLLGGEMYSALVSHFVGQGASKLIVNPRLPLNHADELIELVVTEPISLGILSSINMHSGKESSNKTKVSNSKKSNPYGANYIYTDGRVPSKTNPYGSFHVNFSDYQSKQILDVNKYNYTKGYGGITN